MGTHRFSRFHGIICIELACLTYLVFCDQPLGTRLFLGALALVGLIIASVLLVVGER